MNMFLVICVIACVWYYFSNRAPRSSARGRCSRCGRAATKLTPYVDGRREIWCCEMCQAEMDIVHADSLRLPK